MPTETENDITRDATYLGDGLYTKIRSDGVVMLFAHDGYCITNIVFLEQEVLDAFLRFIGKDTSL